MNGQRACSIHYLTKNNFELYHISDMNDITVVKHS